jgi:hypothetical protein
MLRALIMGANENTTIRGFMIYPVAERLFQRRPAAIKISLVGATPSGKG